MFSFGKILVNLFLAVFLVLALTNLSANSKSVIGDGEVPMVGIPGGEFYMGSENGDHDEKPVHRVLVKEFRIDKYEVTVGQYRKCVDSGKCGKPEAGPYYTWGKEGLDAYPVNGVSWHDAKNHCEFVGKRLPTEAEWEKAATWRKGKKHLYPTGGKKISCKNAVMNTGTDGCGKAFPWRVGSKPPEINGTHDMAGNLWEWVLDGYQSYPLREQANLVRADAVSDQDHIFRGGGWAYDEYFLRGTYRYESEPEFRYFHIGFRCAADLKNANP